MLRNTFSETNTLFILDFSHFWDDEGCLLPQQPTFWALREFFCCNFHHSNSLKD